MTIEEKFKENGLFKAMENLLPQGLYNAELYDIMYLQYHSSKQITRQCELLSVPQIAVVLAGILKSKWEFYNSELKNMEYYQSKTVEKLSSTDTDTSNDSINGTSINSVSGFNSETLEDSSKDTTSNTRVTSKENLKSYDKTTITNKNSGIKELENVLNSFGDLNIMRRFFKDVNEVITTKIYILED